MSETTGVKRYDIVCIGCPGDSQSGGCSTDIAEAPDGNYVRYEDAAELQRRLDAICAIVETDDWAYLRVDHPWIEQIEDVLANNGDNP